MRTISIPLANHRLTITPVHGASNPPTSSGCTSASLAIQCKSWTNSANCASPATTAHTYNSAVSVTTPDQFPASSSTFTASVRASICDCIHLPLLTSGATRLHQRLRLIAQGPGKTRWSLRHAMTTHANVAAAALAHEVPRDQAHHLVLTVRQSY